MQELVLVCNKYNYIMTQEEKELLLQDLCGRLPYGVILSCCDTVGEKLTAIDENGLVNHDYDIDEVKPYLFPTSSMTDEQKTEWAYIDYYADHHEAVNWCNKNHLDYRGLIPLGLAIDATELKIY